MPRIFPEYKRSRVYAMVGAVFHVVVLVLPLIITGGKVKFIGYLFLWFDFPLFLLGLFIPESLRFIFHWMSETSWLLLLGTIIYAMGGWLLGYVTYKYSQRRLKKVGAAIL